MTQEWQGHILNGKTVWTRFYQGEIQTYWWDGGIWSLTIQVKNG